MASTESTFRPDLFQHAAELTRVNMPRPDVDFAFLCDDEVDGVAGAQPQSVPDRFRQASWPLLVSVAVGIPYDYNRFLTYGKGSAMSEGWTKPPANAS